MNRIYDAVDFIKKKENSAFYLYDYQVMDEKIDSLHNALGPDIALAYSLKANPNPEIVKKIGQKIKWFDVASLFEMKVVLKCFDANFKIIYTSPGKSLQELSFAIANNVYVIVCEDIQEIIRISDIAKNLGKVQKIAIRINPSYDNSNLDNSFSNKPSQMGLEEHVAFSLNRILEDNPSVELIGWHFYIGSRNLSAQSIIENTNYIFVVFQKLCDFYKKNFEFLDIGGGFGVNYFNGELPLDLICLKKSFSFLMSELKRKHPKLLVIAESGRFIVAESGYMVTNVITVKISKGVDFAITDSGITSFFLAADNLSNYGKNEKRNFPISVVPGNKSREKIKTYHVVGPTPTTSDVLAIDVPLPEVHPGDILVVSKAGAYGATASLSYFIGQGFPAEYALNNGIISQIKPRVSVDQLLNSYNLP